MNNMLFLQLSILIQRQHQWEPHLAAIRCMYLLDILFFRHRKKPANKPPLDTTENQTNNSWDNIPRHHHLLRSKKPFGKMLARMCNEIHKGS